jgi:hypothetical protein
MLIMSMPIGRIMTRIIVVVMSAQLAHMDAHIPMSSIPDMASEHIVHACMLAEHASIASCIAIMSMPMGISVIGMAFIISAVMFIGSSVRRAPQSVGRPGVWRGL